MVNLLAKENLQILFHMILTYFIYIPSSWNNVKFYGYLTTLLVYDTFYISITSTRSLRNFNVGRSNALSNIPGNISGAVAPVL